MEILGAHRRRCHFCIRCIGASFQFSDSAGAITHRGILCRRPLGALSNVAELSTPRICPSIEGADEAEFVERVGITEMLFDFGERRITERAEC